MKPSKSLEHYCGVTALYSPQPVNVPKDLFFPLFSLQHRGQESAGIAYRKENDPGITVYKDLGMISDVLSRYLHKERRSKVGIGHARYATAGGKSLENAQPYVVDSNKGHIALAHNGNLSNSQQLREKLFSGGSIFQSTSDTEVILHMISRSDAVDFRSALMETLVQLEGAYSMAMIHNDDLVLIRDPWGFRPLYIGFKGDQVYAASETCALDVVGMDSYRSVKPGEVIFVSEKGVESLEIPRKAVNGERRCVFELIYFARPDSEIYDVTVHTKRKAMGRALASVDMDQGMVHNPDTDIVVPVPDSGTPAAMGYATKAGIPFDFGLTRNHYTGRSFILPTGAERELAVKMKLHPIKAIVKGKRVFLVDDSLVRGTTAKILVRLLKDAGAKEVHIRLSSPELKYPCYFGINIPTQEELISTSKTPIQIADYIEADSAKFLPLEQLKKVVVDSNSYCYACFSGNYPLPVPFKGAHSVEAQ